MTIAGMNAESPVWAQAGFLSYRLRISARDVYKQGLVQESACRHYLFRSMKSSRC